jgi:hypothetical protein
MFGDHKGHNVLHPDDAVILIRAEMGNLKREGKLNPAYTDRFLMDINSHLEKADLLKKQLQKTANDKFSALI